MIFGEFVIYLPVYKEKFDTQWVLLKHRLLLAKFKFPVQTANETCLKQRKLHDSFIFGIVYYAQNFIDKQFCIGIDCSVGVKISQFRIGDECSKVL